MLPICRRFWPVSWLCIFSRASNSHLVTQRGKTLWDFSPLSVVDTQA